MPVGGRSTQETQRRVLNRRYARGDNAKAQCPVCGLGSSSTPPCSRTGAVCGFARIVGTRATRKRPSCPLPMRSILDHPAPLVDDVPDNTVELTDQEGFASTFGAAGAKAP